VTAYISRSLLVYVTLLGSRLLPNSATYTNFDNTTMHGTNVKIKFPCILYVPVLYIHNHNPGVGAKLLRLHLENSNVFGTASQLVETE
jgi:hypothetical protein